MPTERMNAVLTFRSTQRWIITERGSDGGGFASYAVGGSFDSFTRGATGERILPTTTYIGQCMN